VVVCDHEALGTHQHARAQRILDALARNAEAVTEELTKERIVEKRRDGLLDSVLDIDVDYSRRRLLHHRREGLLDRDLTLRSGTLLGERRRAKAAG
jgi:hypothetical protein